MATMKSVLTDSMNKIEVVEVERPVPGPKDALVRIRACGTCGTDTFFVQTGGTPYNNPDGTVVPLPLGHEPAGEVVEIGAEVTELKVGDRVVMDPQAAPSGIIGCGGSLGGMNEYLLIEDAVPGESVAVFPDEWPFDVAALNEPMAVARHAVNRSEACPSDKVVVFGADPSAWGHHLARAARRTARRGRHHPRAGRPHWPSAPTRSSTPPPRTSQHP
uniref:Alcohol dehydrogenase catalytic domain-containing protein n=1 Tax=Streptomyces sp. NBC_00093 TaxID=2975649 RepID=A0AAU1ZX30_9ACTN